MDTVLAELSSVSKSYAGVPVLKQVDFSVRSGEIHALLGGNGAGKSTLMKILAGLVSATGGQVRLGGVPLTPATPAQAQAMGLYLVPQEAHIFPNQSVLTNICVGMPKPANAYRARVEALIAQLGVTLSPDAKAATLEIADRQIIEILRGLLREAKVLILDEPTSALTPHEVDTLFGHMRALRMQGHGLIFISHKLHELRKVSDRITVLRDGYVAFARDMNASLDSEILSAMSPGVTALEKRYKAGHAVGAPVLALEELSGEGFANMSFELRAGEIVGLTGVVGAGRTELAETLVGLRSRRAGQITLAGMPFVAKRPRDAVRAGIVHLSEDRQQYGLFQAAPLYWNTSSLINEKLPFLLRPSRERKHFDKYRKMLAIKCASPDQPVGSLSGGNQQKVLLSKCLAATPKVLILDEPTRGVDVGARNDIYRIIDGLAEKGMAVLLISSDFDEVLRLSDRIVVMAGGRLAGELPHGASTDDIAALAFEAGEVIHA